MKTNLVSNLLNFLKKEKIKINLREVSNSEFWLETPDGLITAKFIIDNNAHKILYDIFSTEYDTHLKEETMRDVKEIDFVAEEDFRNWKLVETVENLWLILDAAKLWALKNKFEIEEKEMI